MSLSPFLITDLGSKGEGIGKCQGLTLFVENTLPGDIVEAQLIRQTPRYGFAKLVRLNTPSPNRVQAPCAYVGTCGSCQIQSMAYAAQLRWKKEKIEAAFKRISHLPDMQVGAMYAMQDAYFYRNKAQFPVRLHQGKIQIGFYQTGSHEVVDIDACLVQHPALNTVLVALRAYFIAHPVSVYSEKKHKGLLRHIVMRVSWQTGKVLLCLVINGKEFPRWEALVSALEPTGLLEGVVLNRHEEKNNVIMGKESVCVWGQGALVDTLEGLSFRISPTSFYQINPVQTEVLYQRVLQAAQLTGQEIVLDLFSGIGTIALFLAKHAGQVVGIEEVAEAVEDARYNATQNQIQNADFLCGDVYTQLAAYREKNLKADVIVLDPPRKGCERPVIDEILAASPTRIVYVSCDPATLARDSVHILAGGYRLAACEGVDLFPHTVHIETVALFSKE